MANKSILDAFERMWQHISVALENKSNLKHSHMTVLWKNEDNLDIFAAQDLNIAGICNSDMYPYIVVVHDKGSEIIENKAGNYMLSFNSIGVNNGVNILWYSRQVTLANGVVSFTNCNYANLGYSDNITTIQGSAANANIIPHAILGLDSADLYSQVSLVMEGISNDSY